MLFLKLLLFFLIMMNVSGNDTRCSLNLKDPSLLESYQYLLVKGVLNEISPYYLSTHHDYLIKHNVKAQDIHTLSTSSKLTPEQGAKKMNEVIDKLDQNKKIIIIAHSKGALETLYYLNDHFKAKKPLHHIEKVFLINGPLDGASLYRLAHGDKHERVLFSSLLKKIIPSQYAHSFKPETVRDNLKGIKNNKQLLEKTIFIRSQASFEHIATKYKVTANLYQRTYGDPGDGLLMTSDHIPYELTKLAKHEVCVLTYNMYHDEYLKVFPWDTQMISKVHKFLDQLLLGRS